MTTRYERIKMQRRMQRRIRMVVEERRVAFAAKAAQPVADLETTMEIPLMTQPDRAIGRVSVQQV